MEKMTDNPQRIVVKKNSVVLVMILVSVQSLKIL